MFGKKLPDIPAGYNYDFVNADALISVLQVKNGKIVTPSGMSYEVLALDANAKKMSIPVLRKIGDLVKAGATIAGVKPEQTPSLRDDTAEFNAIVVEVWGRNNKNVYTGQPLTQVLSAINLRADGKQLGIIWKTPFRVDVTEALKPGTNVVEIKVTNLWVNRLIGD